MIDGNLTGLIVEAAWKSVLVAGLALLLLALLKRRSAAERACIAHFGMAALLLLPLMIVAGPSLELLPAAGETAASSAVGSLERQPPAAFAGDTLPAVAEAPGAAAALAGETWLESAALVGGEASLILYFLPAALLLLATFVAVLRLFALRRRASVIVQQNWLTAMAHAQRRMGIKSGTALLVSEELSSPVSWGVLRPIILLSEDALDKPVDAEAIIAHELAHVARLDWVNLLVARFATALFWFNPLVWLLARQAHQLREEAADDAVLRANVPNADYAALLVGAARHESKPMLLAANGVAPAKGSLSLRVRRILEPTLPRSPARLAWGASCAAGALLVAGPLAALSTVSPPELAEAPPAPAAEGAFAYAAAAPAPFAPAAPLAAAPAPASAPAAAPAPAPAGAGLAPAMPAAAIAAATPSGAVVAVGAAPAGQPTPAAPIPPETLVALRAHGINASTHSEYAAAYPRLARHSPDQLMSLRVHNVTPRRLREYAQLGYGNLDLDTLVDWGVHGVTPNYIRALAAEGYGRLTPDQLTEFRVMGVSSRFIREIRESGLSRVSPDRLVEMRIHGTGIPGPRRARPPAVPRSGH